MDRRAIIFARWVLTVHVLLLLAVVGTVFFAVRDVYQTTRAQTLEQAKNAQELLADQTAEGIETLYDSIRNDLDLLRRADRDDALAAVSQLHLQQLAGGALGGVLVPVPLPPLHPIANARPWNGPGNGAGAALAGLLRGQVSTAVAALLWRQLESRASLLFVVEADEIDRYESIEKLAAAVKTGNPPVRQIGPLTGNSDAAVQVAFKMRGWIKGVTEPAISKFEVFGENVTPGNLVCFPAGESSIRPRQAIRQGAKAGDKGPGSKAVDKTIDRATERNAERMTGRRMIVAVVPIKDIERFLNKLNQNERVNASVADEGMVTMVSSDAALVGVNAAEAEDPHVRVLAKRALSSDKAVTVAIEEPYEFGHVIRRPRLFTMQPVDVLNRGADRGRSSQLRWWLMVSSPLSDVDVIVRGMFRKALYWAIGVVVSMTAILVSTAVWLIRGRVRLERVQHEVLTRELSQAREIQLAWLPSKTITTPYVDLAANNTPASHISGDFYNWFELPDGRLVVTIGDVTGHGMSAAFLMATTQLLVRTTMMRVADPGVCLDEVNRQLCTQIFIGQFVSMVIVVLDTRRGELQVSSAGHYMPLLSDGREFKTIPGEPNLVLGVEQNVDYQTETFPLPERASLVMYTDGVLDAINAADQRFKEAGLLRSLSLAPVEGGEHRFENSQAMIDIVLREVDRFRGSLPLPDDLTLVAIQLSAKPTASALILPSQTVLSPG